MEQKKLTLLIIKICSVNINYIHEDEEEEGRQMNPLISKSLVLFD